MALFVNRSADWLRWIVPEEFNDVDLFRIVTFFVFHSPCPDLSSMGRSLADYGWNTPWRKPYHLNEKLKRASSNYNLLFSANTYDALEVALNKADLCSSFPSNFQTERIACVDNKRNQFISVFYHIRNSFAHCRLNMVDVDGECTFILEDGVQKKNENQLKLSARMIIKKQTLLNWIDIIEKGEYED